MTEPERFRFYRHDDDVKKPLRFLETTLYTALALVVIPSTALASAADTLPPLGNYAIRNWTTQDGLPQNSMRDITQGPSCMRHRGIILPYIIQRPVIIAPAEILFRTTICGAGNEWITTDRSRTLTKWEIGCFGKSISFSEAAFTPPIWLRA